MIYSFTLGWADSPSPFLYLSLSVLISLKALISEISWTATDMRWSSSPSIFLPSGSTVAYFGREKQFNEALTARMSVRSGASGFSFYSLPGYLCMEARCTYTWQDRKPSWFLNHINPLVRASDSFIPLTEFHMRPAYLAGSKTHTPARTHASPRTERALTNDRGAITFALMLWTRGEESPELDLFGALLLLAICSPRTSWPCGGVCGWTGNPSSLRVACITAMADWQMLMVCTWAHMEHISQQVTVLALICALAGVLVCYDSLARVCTPLLNLQLCCSSSDGSS